jgi:deazaflavin-dependent oxidoreductase (nitroreductase family)
MSGITGTEGGVDARYERLLDPRVLESMRRSFNQMNKGMVPLWRLGLGRMMNAWPERSGQLLVLEHVGRKSGTSYRTPVNYAQVGGDIYVLAAFGKKTHWYRNILAAPEMAVWLPDGRWLAHAEDASDDPKRLDIVRQVLVNSGFVAPMIGLHPRRMSDEDLDEATSMYRLLRIHPVHTESVADGPGSLAWVWVVAGTAVLVAVALGIARCRRPGSGGAA